MYCESLPLQSSRLLVTLSFQKTSLNSSPAAPSVSMASGIISVSNIIYRGLPSYMSLLDLAPAITTSYIVGCPLVTIDALSSVATDSVSFCLTCVVRPRDPSRWVRPHGVLMRPISRCLDPLHYHLDRIVVSLLSPVAPCATASKVSTVMVPCCPSHERALYVAPALPSLQVLPHCQFHSKSERYFKQVSRPGS